MIQGGKENPYLTHTGKVSGLLEVPLAVLRLRRSVGQRSEITQETAQDWLGSAMKIGVESGLFGSSASEATIGRRIGSGFNTSIFLFKAEEKNWVLKIGARRAPVPGWFDPSSLEYAEWYAGNLEVFRNHFQELLPHLIPWPQYVVYARNSRSEWSTLVIQPFISNTIVLEDVSSQQLTVKKAILDELVIFYEQCQGLYQRHKFIPDFGGRRNIVIQQVGDEHHLVLLDNGMIDFKAVSPVLNSWSAFIYHYRLGRAISRLKKSIGHVPV